MENKISSLNTLLVLTEVKRQYIKQKLSRAGYRDFYWSLVGINST